MRIKATLAFRERVARLLAGAEYESLLAYLADNPQAGDVVAGTGGVRKLRWGMAGRGKRGGARVLYLYLGHAGTLWLLDIYSKREKAGLSLADVKAIKDMVTAIKKAERAR